MSHPIIPGRPHLTDQGRASCASGVKGLAGPPLSGGSPARASVIASVPGADIKASDVLVAFGTLRRVDRIEPYVWGGQGPAPAWTYGVRLAKSGDTWGVALFPQQEFLVLAVQS